MIYYIIIIFILYEGYKGLGNLTDDVFDRQSYEGLNSLQYKVNPLEVLHRKISYTSGLKETFVHLNVYSFMGLSVVIAIFVSYLFFSFTGLLFASLLLGLGGLILPWLVLSTWCEKKNATLSTEMVTFISLMSRWATVKDDIYFCIEKSSETVGVSLKKYLKNFLMYVKYTGLSDEGFQRLLLYSENEMYRNFIINLQQAAYSKGDLCQLLERLEEEAYLIEGEHSRLIYETFWDRFIIGSVGVVTLLISGIVLYFNPLMQDFYFDTSFGQILLTLYIILFLLSIYVASKITNFNY
jgi:Flp pilus assembly protein TadB